MPVLQVTASTEELVRAVEQLPTDDLDTFVRRIIALRAARVAPSLSAIESDLFARINRDIPSDLHQRYNELVARRRAETITPEEYDELLQLSDGIEEMNAERIAALAELAGVRGVPLPELMKTLDIRPLADD